MITFSKLGRLGRLGNCMFQIAATIGTAVRNNTNYGVPIWEHSGLFKYPVPFARSSKYQFKEIGFHYSPIDGNDLDLVGYFQSEKYFSHCEPLIRHHFQFSDSVERYCKKYEQYFTENYCAIHIRRGDYLKGNYHKALPLQYFMNAIEHFPGKQFVIFTDDPQWCKENFDYEVIQGNKPIYDLAIMSKFKNHIISNSSFSWWAAWLAKSKTVAPMDWFGEDAKHLSTKDLYLNNWIIESCDNTVSL
jgi:hypothetical protein